MTKHYFQILNETKKETLVFGIDNENGIINCELPQCYNIQHRCEHVKQIRSKRLQSVFEKKGYPIPSTELSRIHNLP